MGKWWNRHTQQAEDEHWTSSVSYFHKPAPRRLHHCIATCFTSAVTTIHSASGGWVRTGVGGYFVVTWLTPKLVRSPLITPSPTQWHPPHVRCTRFSVKKNDSRWPNNRDAQPDTVQLFVLWRLTTSEVWPMVACEGFWVWGILEENLFVSSIMSHHDPNWLQRLTKVCSPRRDLINVAPTKSERQASSKWPSRSERQTSSNGQGQRDCLFYNGSCL